MSDKLSFHFRSRGREMNAIAAEARDIVRAAAEPVRPGETVKAQLRRAARALGFRDGDWRIRAAWYGEAGSWSAAAFEELRACWRAHNESKDRALRAEAALAASRLAHLRTVLAEANDPVLGPEIDALEHAIRELRRGAHEDLGGKA